MYMVDIRLATGEVKHARTNELPVHDDHNNLAIALAVGGALVYAAGHYAGYAVREIKESNDG
ncbi:hypothetical protein J4U00_gp059 [Mycobacterium phage DyoEdafos]|uniref:Uncharacterized protein n=1 Tax=Mycobacterium phage DyoEdafos TaxID=2599860 RepID=A0A5J6TIR0_9CAUD|nr:hypothetical protein J4U00_gp059 [Mycobacterium phage DyoEdafos]QFG10288.1 hypothetical protein SEA_DYOEDAFOS_59 [Mycobacterium phage DyoEdafos]